MKKYQEYMFNLELSRLKEYLGKNVVEMLVEWDPKGEANLTKQRLIYMIESLHGTSIFKKKEFRKDLLLSMRKEDVFQIRDNCLSAREKQEDDPLQLIEIIAGKTWGNNQISKYLLGMWGVDPAIVEKQASSDENISNDISAGKRFFELLDYQYYIKQRVLYNLNSGNLQERLLVHMPTGTGKTKTTMHIIANYISFSLNKKGIVIWVAHTTELLQQAYNTFVDVWSHLGDGDIKAYKLWGSKDIVDTDTSLDGIVFCGLAKLMSIADSNPALYERLKRDCRLVVFDEAHKAAAKKTRNVIEGLLRMPEGYENRALVGLSATPGRTTEASYDNNLLANMFGNKLISIDTNLINQINMGKLRALNTLAESNIIKYFQHRRILSKIEVKRLVYQTEFSAEDIKLLSKALRKIGYDETDFSDKQLQLFAFNKARNRKIMEELRDLYNRNVPTIVFACSVDHAKMLSAMLTLEGIDNSLVIGEMNPVDRNSAIEAFKDRSNKTNILINYEVLTTGFDSKNIRCVFITRPTKSVVLYSQMLGRGLRGPAMGGNESCLLIDIDDNLKAFDNETAFLHFNDYWFS